MKKLFALIFLIMLMMPLWLMAAEQAAPGESMKATGTVAKLAVIVIAITGFIRKLFPKLGKPLLVGITAVVSAGACAWHYVESGMSFEIIGFVVLLIAVFAASNGAYNAVKFMVKGR